MKKRAVTLILGLSLAACDAGVVEEAQKTLPTPDVSASQAALSGPNWASERCNQNSGKNFGDLHAHSSAANENLPNPNGTHSFGNPRNLFKRAAGQYHSDFLAITDHSKYFSPSANTTKCSNGKINVSDFTPMCGLEYEGSKSHVLVIGLPELTGLPKKKSWADGIGFISSQSAVGICAHPCSKKVARSCRISSGGVPDADIHMVELNGQCGGGAYWPIREYFAFLNDDWQVSPAYDSDRHGSVGDHQGWMSAAPAHYDTRSAGKGTVVVNASNTEGALKDSMKVRQTSARIAWGGDDATVGIKVDNCEGGSVLKNRSTVTITADTVNAPVGYTITIFAGPGGKSKPLGGGLKRCENQPSCTWTGSITPYDWAVAVATPDLKPSKATLKPTLVSAPIWFK